VLLSEALSWIGPGVPNRPSDEDLEPLRGLASTLGGDVAIALDGPVLPVPSWKVVVEVYDPVRFQSELTNLVSRLNDRIASEGHEGRIVVERADTGNRTDWVVRFTGTEAEGHAMRYTFADGYLIAAPSQVLIDRAIEQRANGYTLARSTEFAALLPTDGQVNLSAFVWQHLGPTIGPLASKLSGAIAGEQLNALGQLSSDSKPRLVTAYAEDDRIVISARGEAGLGSLLGSMISAQQLSSLGTVLDHARHAKDTTPQ
jgi:hypothetical protein